MPAVFCSPTQESYYPCQLYHTLALKLNEELEHVQELAEKMPHTKKRKKREDAAPKPVECIGNCVSIECDGKAYQGFVEDADLAQVYVNCMHSVGKEMHDCFYWPRPFLDLIWYDHDQILAIIPKP